MWYVKRQGWFSCYYDIWFDPDEGSYVCYEYLNKSSVLQYKTKEAAQKDIDRLCECGVFLVPVFEQEENW
jgi:hypothetical protein